MPIDIRYHIRYEFDNTGIWHIFVNVFVILYTSKGSRCESVVNLGGNTGSLVLFIGRDFIYIIETALHFL